jgi:hypothetical protein
MLYSPRWLKELLDDYIVNNLTRVLLNGIEKTVKLPKHLRDLCTSKTYEA